MDFALFVLACNSIKNCYCDHSFYNYSYDSHCCRYIAFMKTAAHIVVQGLMNIYHCIEMINNDIHMIKLQMCLQWISLGQ